MIEEWKPIHGYEGLYEVSNTGKIRNSSLHEMKDLGYHRYKRTLLYKDGKYKNVYFHQAVAEAFLSPAPSELYEVNHKDGVRENCAASNLEWMTHAENQQHAYDTGLKSTKPVIQVSLVDGSIVAEYRSACEAKRKTGINQPHITDVCNGKRNKAGGFAWRHK